MIIALDNFKHFLFKHDFVLEKIHKCYLKLTVY